MTCIVAITDGKTVFMGGDRFTTDGKTVFMGGVTHWL